MHDTPNGTPNPPELHRLTDDDVDEEAEKKRLIAKLRDQRQYAAHQAILGNAALARLVPVLAAHSGQSYKLRGILYSLWNGLPYSLLQIVNLDTAIRRDLALLIVAWGYEGCFYDQLKEAVQVAGQWNWFLDQADDIEEMMEAVQSAERRRRQ